MLFSELHCCYGASYNNIPGYKICIFAYENKTKPSISTRIDHEKPRVNNYQARRYCTCHTVGLAYLVTATRVVPNLLLPYSFRRTHNVKQSTPSRRMDERVIQITKRPLLHFLEAKNINDYRQVSVRTPYEVMISELHF